MKGERNLPIHKFDGEYDKNLPKINLVNEKTPQKNIKTCMSTSFGFGGTNAVMILSAGQLGSEADKRNILISPLEGEKKFLSELCELRNFREG